MRAQHVMTLALVVALSACGSEAVSSDEPASSAATTANPPSTTTTASSTPTTPSSPTAATAAGASAAPPEIDAATGLKKAPGYELVAANCIACHSSKLITANRGDRARWEETIRWMQKTQGLWPLAADVEDKILTYLSTHYAPDASVRRRPIAPSLMPPSPDEIAKARAQSALMQDPRVARAKEALAPFQKALMGALQEGLAKGPREAVVACHDRAPKIAAESASPGVVVGRTTTKLRNQANAPEAWATPILDELATLPAAARAPRVVVVDDAALGAETLVYAAPITMGAMCLTCHGETLAPEVDQAIRERYPDDQARGYREGELRGLFYVKLAKR